MGEKHKVILLARGNSVLLKYILGGGGTWGESPGENVKKENGLVLIFVERFVATFA